ncbi:pilus assembly protein PilY [Pseudoduganella sp. FT25W]|uniref:Pilus assembly protein PilY n=1 Tax=Duganella alba TaxID=2666081 RepID=A0A6L5QLY5_9BURK|nr:PilC/PilY family type IV pilus protein [Duganella alba]MRX10739.1 pilus assembly protein PilY [Duganella alba]MRX18619.1 pilus assembly protein PilY [Duganella alba]
MKALQLMLLLAASAQAASPVLDIDSLPVAAACKPGKAPAGQANGPMLLRPTSTAVAPLTMPPAVPPAVPTATVGDLYQSTTDIGDWSGHFSRYVLAAGTAGAGTVSTLVWDAGGVLTGSAARPPEPAAEQRNIYTAVVQPSGALAMAPFAWLALSAAQQALLNLEDGVGEQRLAYLRGDRSLEGKQFRSRSSVLGDSVHSTPVYVGAVDHREAVYLGANDGMLHAFDAISGVELFAYVPDALIPTLHHLSDPAYVHRAYVDGPASVGEARIGVDKKTVLLSAMGGGARGLFALDVTDPAHFAGGLGVLWEFTGRDDPLMGNVITMPQIAQVRVSAGAVRSFAVVASGINGDGEGKGALFLLALDKPRDEGWKINSNYYRIATPVADATLANALSAPVLLNDRDGALQYAYAGDLQGNLWRFDFSGSAPWSGAVGSPLFVAKDAKGHRQPITEQPLLAYAKVRGYVVLFGTGRLIEKADRSISAITQSYYGIIDSLQTPQEVITGRSQLTPRFLDGSGALLSITGAPMASESKGWYVDFVQGTERSINAGVLSDGAVLFNTVQPGADVCSATRSRSYALNALTGLPDSDRFTAILPTKDAIVGLMLPDYIPMPLVLPQSATPGPRDATGRIVQSKDAALVQAGEAGKITTIGSVKATRRAGRLSWREIANWRELHEAAK